MFVLSQIAKAHQDYDGVGIRDFRPERFRIRANGLRSSQYRDRRGESAMGKRNTSVSGNREGGANPGNDFEFDPG